MVRRPTRLFVPLAVAAALMLALPGTAMAGQSTPKIRRDNATGAAYSGNVQIRNLNSVFFTGNAPFVGVIDTECQFADLRGHVNSDGTGGAITSVQIDNNGAGAACPNNKGGTTTITAVNVNGTGQVYYDPDHPGGRDGYLFLSGNNPNVKIKAVITMADIPDPQSCYYGLTGGAPDLYIDIWNKDNGSRPDTSVNEAEGQANGQQ